MAANIIVKKKDLTASLMLVIFATISKMRPKNTSRTVVRRLPMARLKAIPAYFAFFLSKKEMPRKKNPNAKT